MKTHMNLSIEKDLVKKIKAYAEKRQISVSDLVEAYFSKIVKPSKTFTVIDLIEGLEKPVLEEGTDLKKSFYEQQSSKYGF
ncbi:DUF6364 family protein [Mucilaginibacter antarcticus]|uniref:DUF6364 family protein n=1 Tax=Mucilaginibacter antarcticus TaxID=1855725 RepID=A0ABW5XJ92_9SPHI